MRFLITGGFGYLGSYCAEYLKSKGNEVTILGRKIPVYMEQWAKKFNIITGDITEENLSGKIPTDRYDCVIHFAAANEVKCKNNPKEAIVINTFGTENILNICEKLNIKRFIYISTFHVYGNSILNGVVNEKNNIETSSLYGMTHYFGELLTKSYTEKMN